MLPESTILAALPDALEGVDFPWLGEKQQGKVRDIYVKDDQRIMITTDRQSAFDHVLGLIPYKGAVLNLLAEFWFNETKDIVANHMLSVPDPNVLIARNCQPIPVEMVVRGYISGVTKTSIWYSYNAGERNIYGIDFPDGLRKNQQLPTPVITPTTHGGGVGGHDDRLTRAQIIERNLVPETLYTQMEETASALFKFGSTLVKERGLILVDTKYEFGLFDGKLMLMDEIHTPDSSRFWKADTYAERFEHGEEPENFDKEYLRLWYAERGYTGDGTPPKMTNELITTMANRYITAYEQITKKPFPPFDYPVESRIEAALKTALNQS